jgi:voltage-gated potassium channel
MRYTIFPMAKAVSVTSRFEKWRFLQLTMFIVLFMLLSPILDRLGIIQILTQLFLLNSLLVTVSAAGENPRLKRIVWILWSLSLVGAFLILFPLPPGLKTLSAILENFFRFSLLIVFIVSILAMIFRSQQVTLDGIFAVVVCYLMIAAAFGMLYSMLNSVHPGSFQGLGTQSNIQEMTYFSLVTLATLGYGDILPVTHTARTLAILEAVVGQFYVAVIVALLVGMFISQRIDDHRT